MGFVLPKRGLSRAQVEAAIADAADALPWLSGTYRDLASARTPNSRTTMTVGANTLYGTPLFVPYDVSIDLLTLNVFTGATGNARLGLYTMNLSLLAPGTLIAEGAAAVDTSGAAGDRTATVDLDLDGGAWYWVAAVFSGTPVILSYTMNHDLFGLISGGGTPTAAVTAAHTYGALPATFPAISRTTSVPRLAVRVA